MPIPWRRSRLASATLDYARDGAQHGVLLTTLMRSYRLGHAATSPHLRAILAKHAADAEELTSATDLCSAWLFAYVDTALCLVEDVYVTERERWIRSAAASQAEAISTILSGQPIDIDVAGRRLRHDLRRVHVAAIAWLDAHEEGRNTLALLEAAIRDVAAAIGTQRPLIQPLGTLSVAAWVSTSSPVPSRVLDELRFRTATAPGSAWLSANRRATSRDFVPAMSRHSKHSGSRGRQAAGKAASPATATSLCAHSPP